jgi:hypothetical protein
MKELAAIVKISKDIFLFAAAFIRVPFGSMTYDNAAANNTAARRYLDLLRHVLCRDRFPDARYDMSSGSLQVRTGYSCSRCGEEIRLNARKFRA